jgi:hypothetical protein
MKEIITGIKIKNIIIVVIKFIFNQIDLVNQNLDIYFLKYLGNKKLVIIS